MQLVIVAGWALPAPCFHLVEKLIMFAAFILVKFVLSCVSLVIYHAASTLVCAFCFVEVFSKEKTVADYKEHKVSSHICLMECEMKLFGKYSAD